MILCLCVSETGQDDGSLEHFCGCYTELAITRGRIDYLEKMAHLGVYFSVRPPKKSALDFILNYRVKYSLNKKLKMIQILIKSGENILVTNRKGVTILHDIANLLMATKQANKNNMIEELRTYADNTNELNLCLHQICRKVIRVALGRKCTRVNISTLPLPKPLQDFLLFSDCPITQWDL